MCLYMWAVSLTVWFTITTVRTVYERMQFLYIDVKTLLNSIFTLIVSFVWKRYFRKKSMAWQSVNSDLRPESRVIEDRLSLSCCDTIFYSQKLHQNRSLAHACPFVRIYCTHVHSTVDLFYLLTKFPYNASDNHGTCVYGQCSLTSISALTTLSPFDARFVNPYYKIV